MLKNFLLKTCILLIVTALIPLMIHTYDLCQENFEPKPPHNYSKGSRCETHQFETQQCCPVAQTLDWTRILFYEKSHLSKVYIDTQPDLFCYCPPFNFKIIKPFQFCHYQHFTVIWPEKTFTLHSRADACKVFNSLPLYNTRYCNCLMESVEVCHISLNDFGMACSLFWNSIAIQEMLNRLNDELSSIISHKAFYQLLTDDDIDTFQKADSNVNVYVFKIRHYQNATT